MRAIEGESALALEVDYRWILRGGIEPWKVNGPEREPKGHEL